MSGRMSESSQISEAIRKEAIDCKISAADMRNTPDDRNVFHVVSIILEGIAEKIEKA
jgi:hypothetical protein